MGSTSAVAPADAADAAARSSAGSFAAGFLSSSPSPSSFLDAAPSSLSFVDRGDSARLCGCLPRKGTGVLTAAVAPSPSRSLRRFDGGIVRTSSRGAPPAASALPLPLPSPIAPGDSSPAGLVFAAPWFEPSMVLKVYRGDVVINHQAQHEIKWLKMKKRSPPPLRSKAQKLEKLKHKRGT